jgi:hypothetical protein
MYLLTEGSLQRPEHKQKVTAETSVVFFKPQKTHEKYKNHIQLLQSPRPEKKVRSLVARTCRGKKFMLTERCCYLTGDSVMAASQNGF